MRFGRRVRLRLWGGGRGWLFDVRQWDVGRFSVLDVR